MPFLEDLFTETVLDLLQKKIESANSDDDRKNVMENFKKIDLSKLFETLFETASDNAFSYMKNTMFEEVMRFRARNLEFYSHQEQLWNKAFVASEALYIMIATTKGINSDKFESV